MSVIIHNFIVHRLALKEQQLLLLPRNQLCDVTPEIELLAQQLNHAFNGKPGKGIGGFTETPEPETTQETDDDSENNERSVAEWAEFKSNLDGLLDGSKDFIAFSSAASELLKKRLIEFATPEAGFLVFSHFQFLATDYLLIGLVNTKEHVEIDQQLELTVSSHLDLAKMQLAAKIDITQYQTNPAQNRYISFIKGRAGRKVADFFMHFLGCEELVDTKVMNKQLVSNVEQYLESEQLQPEEKQASREVVAQYYKDQLESGEDIDVKDLAESLSFADQKQDFYAFSQSAESPLEESFQPDRSAIKTLNKFSGQGGGITLSFDRKLLGEKVNYDPHSDTLVIKGIPPNLKDQLLKWQD